MTLTIKLLTLAASIAVVACLQTGCGLVAKSPVSEAIEQPQVESLEVIVGAKDIPAGTILTKEELPTLIKLQKVPQDLLPPLYVGSQDELIGKRLARAVSENEVFDSKDLRKVVTLPKGMDMLSIPVTMPEAVAQYVTPGSRVEIVATVKRKDRPLVFTLLVDMLVVAVDVGGGIPKPGINQDQERVISVAVDREQALVVQLARARGCVLEIVLHHGGKLSPEEMEWSLDGVRRRLESENFAAEASDP